MQWKLSHTPEENQQANKIYSSVFFQNEQIKICVSYLTCLLTWKSDINHTKGQAHSPRIFRPGFGFWFCL